MDTLKFLSVGNNLECVRVEANEVLPLISYLRPNSTGAPQMSHLRESIFYFNSFYLTCSILLCMIFSLSRSLCIELLSSQLYVDYGLPPMSQSTISRIKKEHFNNVSIKPVGSSFAKCSLCDQLQQFLMKLPKGSPEFVEFSKQRIDHHNHQASCRRLYASWQEESKKNP